MTVYEVVIERENGDRDTLYLCDNCLTSVDDYATRLKQTVTIGDCERCGWPTDFVPEEDS